MSNLIKATSEAILIDVSDRFGYIIDKPIINETIIYAPLDIALREHAEREIELESDKATYNLEFFSIWLDNFIYAKNRRRTPAGYEGITTGEFGDATKDSLKSYRAVPVDLLYSITFWTLYKERIDKFLLEYVFWQSSTPYLDMFYDSNKELRFPVFIEEHPALDSTVSEMYIKGKYWRHTIKAKVEAWLIKGISYSTVKKIILDVYVDYEGTHVKSAENLILEVITGSGI